MTSTTTSTSARAADRPRRTTRQRVLAAGIGLLAIPVVFALMIIWHECGHTVAAWLVGDLTARFEFVDLDYPCVGCNLYDSAALNPIPNIIVNIAGVVASQLLAWGAVLLLVRRRWSLVATWLIADLLLVALADLVWQCVQGILFGAYNPIPLGQAVTYVDGSAIVYLLHVVTALPQGVIAAGLVTLAAVDLVLVGMVLILGVRRRRAAARASDDSAPVMVQA